MRTDLPFSGYFHTWSNNHTASKLDRALRNEAWLNTYVNFIAQFALPGVSDHSPVMVMSGIRKAARLRIPFQFKGK